MSNSMTDGAQVINIFAHRVGRKCFLLGNCAPGHPVLNAEQMLVEIAYSKLMERLLILYPNRKISKIWPVLRCSIAKEARRWVHTYEVDKHTFNSICKRINNELTHFAPVMG